IAAPDVHGNYIAITFHHSNGVCEPPSLGRLGGFSLRGVPRGVSMSHGLNEWDLSRVCTVCQSERIRHCYPSDFKAFIARSLSGSLPHLSERISDMTPWQFQDLSKEIERRQSQKNVGW